MTSSNRFRTWWDTILPEIQDLAYANGYILRTEDHGKSGKKYSIVTKQLDEALSNINLNNEF